MIVINRFVIQPLTIGKCLALKNLDLSKYDALSRDYLILSIISNVSSLEQIAGIYMYMTVEQLSEIRSICLACMAASEQLDHVSIYSIIFKLNGNSFSNWESVLSIPFHHIVYFVHVINQYHTDLQNAQR